MIRWAFIAWCVIAYLIVALLARNVFIDVLWAIPFGIIFLCMYKLEHRR